MLVDNYYLARQEGRAPWDDLVRDGMVYLVFRDRFPVTLGHLLFVPKVTDSLTMTTTMYAALTEAQFMMQQKQCEGFNIGINWGEAAGQTVMYPHIHLIPRRAGDCEDPVGGVRAVIPGQANYRKPGYQQP